MSKPTQQVALDANQHRQFVQYFNSLPEKPPTTIRFFHRIDFYTVHGQDAKFAAKEVFKTSSFIKNGGSGDMQLDYLVLNKSQFETFVKDLLLVKRYRVEVYVNKKTRSDPLWVLEFKGSPGNLSQFEDMLFANSDQVESPAVLAVRLTTNAKNKIIGLASVDIPAHTMSLCEFPDDEHFSNLEAMVVQIGPKEVLIPAETSLEAEKIKLIMERSGALVTVCKKSDFSTDNLVQDMNKLILFKEGQQQNANALPQLNLATATGALAALVKYLELCSDQENLGQFVMVTLDQARYVYLDTAAVNALNLLPTPGALAHRKNHSVLGLLDKCCTPQGHRLLSQWVKQPLKDLAAINERLDVVECLLDDMELRQSLLEDHLRRIPDLHALAKRIQRKKATMQDCYRIYQAMQRLPHLLAALKNQNGGHAHPTLRSVLIEPLDELIGDMHNFQEMIETTLDMDYVDRGEFLIKPEFDEDLQEVREKMNDLEEKIKSQLNKAARDLGLEPHKTIKLESNSQYGYFFRVSLKDEKALRGQTTYTVLDSVKNGVKFRSQKLTNLNEEYSQLKEQYTEMQKKVVGEVITVAVSYATPLLQLSDVLAWLDVVTSFAAVSAGAPGPYVRPKMSAPCERVAPVMRLKQCRHPCLEMLTNTTYIPNDIEMEGGKCTFLMVTGPNMGGKSTYIRSAGVAALLAHIGCFVPCDEAEMTVLDAILARVGASDSQIKGMSTFMVEMVETASILRMATPNSLVIIDELGRGTSTYEGCGIAWAIAEYLAKEVGAFSLFATHFHELTRLPELVPTVHNCHVTAVTSDDDNSLTLLYEVRPGACDQSFGIHCAKMARFPNQVIEDAKQKLADLEDYQGAITVSDSATKRKIIKEGEELISEFLSECKKLKTDGLSDEDLEKAVTKLKDKIAMKNNPYVSALGASA